MRPPVQFLLFWRSFWQKFCQIIGWRHYSLRLKPLPSGKSGTHYWLSVCRAIDAPVFNNVWCPWSNCSVFPRCKLRTILSKSFPAFCWCLLTYCPVTLIMCLWVTESVQSVNKKTDKTTNPCFISPRSTSGKASFGVMGQFQSELEQFWALLMVEEKPQRENHLGLAVKCETYPMCHMEDSNPGRSQDSNPDRTSERRTCYKAQWLIAHSDCI